MDWCVGVMLGAGVVGNATLNVLMHSAALGWKMNAKHMLGVLHTALGIL